MAELRILLLNMGPESTEAVLQALTGQGYDIVADRDLTVDEILAVSPGLLITEATPSNLNCCGLISQIKISSDQRGLKVLMVVHGDAIERARGLDLGADEVAAFPFEPLELAAQVRTQFRQRQPELELQTELADALAREHLAESAAQRLGGIALSRWRWRLWMLLVACVLSAGAVLASLSTVVSNRRSRNDELRMKAEIARLGSGFLQEEQPLGRARDPKLAGDKQGTRPSTEARNEAVRKEMGASGAADDESLKKQLLDTQSQLKRLEHESRSAEAIVHKYGPSVCLLHVTVGLRDKNSGQILRIAVDPAGSPLVNGGGMISLQTDGKGPPLQLDFWGTGFLVTNDGRILTNHHVVEPWWTEPYLKALLDRDAEAFASSYMAYFPGTPQGITVRLDRLSDRADLATLRLDGPAPPDVPFLELDDRVEASVPGDPVILIGYPTGIEGILARAGTDVTRKVTENTQNLTEVVSRLAGQHLVRPTITQGHIGDVLTDKIVYDAATTVGGSGGPLFNYDGKVIGVSDAILKDFGGSNLAIPVRYAIELLK